MAFTLPYIGDKVYAEENENSTSSLERSTVRKSILNAALYLKDYNPVGYPFSGAFNMSNTLVKVVSESVSSENYSEYINEPKWFTKKCIYKDRNDQYFYVNIRGDFYAAPYNYYITADQIYYIGSGEGYTNKKIKWNYGMNDHLTIFAINDILNKSNDTITVNGVTFGFQGNDNYITPPTIKASENATLKFEAWGAGVQRCW